MGPARQEKKNNSARKKSRAIALKHLAAADDYVLLYINYDVVNGQVKVDSDTTMPINAVSDFLRQTAAGFDKMIVQPKEN